jgi:drug/metabolite transporter (DMT)-like permease
MARPHALDIALLALGVLACSTSVIFIKQSAVHPVLLPAYRLGFGAVLLLPAFLWQWRAGPGAYTRAHVRRSVLPAALLALHFVAWTAGARMTPSANGSLLVNLVPLVMPFLLYAQAGEVVNRREIAGTALALAGILWLGAGDFRLDRSHLAGDLLCLLAMVLFALYLVAARRNRDVPGIWLYVVPLYAMASAMCFAAALPLTPVFAVLPAREYLLLLALAAVPTVIGHTLLNHAMRRVRGQVVSVGTTNQFVFAGALAWLLLGEVPRPGFYPAAALVAAGAWLVIRGLPLRLSREPPGEGPPGADPARR